MSTQAPERSEELAASLAAAQAFRSGQLGIRAKYLREFADVWPILRQGDAQRWLRLNVALVRRWQQPSRSLALEFLRGQQEAQTGRTMRPTTPTPMPDQQIVRNLLARGPGVVKRARLVGLDELEAWERGEAAAMASGGRLVLAGGRDGMGEQQPLGFMRVTDGDPCYWCAMLASRGAVYATARDAGEENTYHDSCGCTVLPIFARTDFMSAEASRWRALWDQTHPTGGINAFRKAYDAQRGSLPAAA